MLGQGDMAGSVQIKMSNVIQPGDSLTIWIDKTAMLFRKVVIATTYEQNPVTNKLEPTFPKKSHIQRMATGLGIVLLMVRNKELLY